MGGFMTDDFCPVRRPGPRLEGERLTISKLATKVRIYPHPVHYHLIQRTLNVEKVGNRPLHHEVHGAEFTNQVF